MPLPEVILVVTIDVEEDNWGQHRKGISVKNVEGILRAQSLFDRYGIKPSYLVSYQVAISDWAVSILSDMVIHRKCEIGAHLHPWNTPPISESLTPRNSMLLNLPYQLQLAKVRSLTNQIERAFKIRPNSFRAGRWGLGSDTIKALINCGYQIDTSVTPTISWRETGNGPIYRDSRTEPHRLLVNVDSAEENQGSILEVPVTIGFNRWPFQFWQKIYNLLQKNYLKPFRAAGLLHRSGLLRKIWLCPEMSTTEDMIILTKVMTKHGKVFLNLCFHSNSLLPGKGPFVKDSEQLNQFLFSLVRILEYLSTVTTFRPLTLSELEASFQTN